MGTAARSTPPWHALSAEETLKRLGADAVRGLATPEARRRLRAHGPNDFDEHRPKSPWAILRSQLEDFMVLVLLGAAAVSSLLGEFADAVAILSIVAVNAALGYLQESRAERSLEALRRLAAPVARVLRDGRVTEVPAREVVPGDVLVLAAGDRVPADGRLLSAVGLEVEEAPLTGESVPVEKSVAPLQAEDVPPGDRRNMVFQGTHVARGHGRAVAVATGMRTEVGHIAGLIHGAAEQQTPLQRRLDQVGRLLVLACLGISAAVVAAGVLQGEDPYRMFLAGVSLAVAAIPEGLPAVVTISLALGVQRMIRKNAIVRRLPAVETLGCATVICTDKTGTLTRNAMAVRAVWAGGRQYDVEGGGWPGLRRVLATPEGAPLRMVLEAAAVCHSLAAAGGAGSYRGDPTEVALLAAAQAAGLDPAGLAERWPRLCEVPFEPERRRMTVVCRTPHGPRAYVKGAADEVLRRCAWVAVGGHVVPCDEDWRQRIRAAADRMAASALRVLAVAERDVREGERDPEALEGHLVFCGLVGLMDPPRPEAREAVRRCREAGIRTVMITGDHALTARAVAEEVGLLTPGGGIATGPDLAGWSDEELERRVDGISVFARVSPADKLRIVRALKARGHVVAMTGDGVNDAPAVKEADIGIAMGRTGTDVTKEASAMVLTDDNFATIVAAVEEGRAVYDNIRKFIRYLLACNMGEILVMLLGTLAGLPLPLLPLQMLLVNLVTDGLPALALGVDPPAADVMRRPPRDPREGLFARGLGRLILLRGVTIGLASLAVFTAAVRAGAGLATARTMATCTLVLSQLVHSFDARSEGPAGGRLGLWSNRVLLVAVGSSLGILLTVVHVPSLASLFRMAPLGAGQWGLVVLATVVGAAVATAGQAVRGWVGRGLRALAGRA